MAQTNMYNSYEEFCKREDKTHNGILNESLDEVPDYNKDGATNIGCWECIKSTYCVNCTWLVNCHNVNGFHDAIGINAKEKDDE